MRTECVWQILKTTGNTDDGIVHHKRALKYYKRNKNKLVRQKHLSKTPGPKSGPFKPLG